ncbi:MAG: hypothetical protein ACAI35_00825 [Candidatus Methylacidiphilales bacterium]|nr:hypothetical protein [Candidatus Methylacidiphilales bacterium]
MAANTDPVTMVDMEQKLREDPEGAYRDYALGRFVQLQNSVQVELNRGLAPDEFEAFNRIKLAAENAQAIVQIVWAKNNSTSATAPATSLPGLL